MFTAILFIKSKSRNSPNIHEWMNGIKQMPHYLYKGTLTAIKRNEIRIHVITQTNPENITPSERSQIQKNHVFYDPIYVKSPE